MKRIFICIFMVMSLFFFSISIFGENITHDIASSISGELSGFKDALPNHVLEYLPKDIFEGNYDSLINGDIDESSLLELSVSYLLAGIDKVLKSFGAILSLIIIISIFNSLSSCTAGVNNILSLCSTLCISVAVFTVCQQITVMTCEYLNILCGVMKSFIPIIIALLTMSGNISSAAIINGSILLIINLVEGFLIVFMLPLIKMCLSFACIKGAGQGLDFSGISKTVKNTFSSVTVFVMSILMFVLSFRSTLSQSADSLSIKTARFAISSFVPLVGSSVNETLRTVNSSLDLIKKSSGIIGIISLAVLMLPIIINLFLNKLSFSILSSLAKLINVNNESSILDEADSVCGFLLTIVSCTCVLFIFALTIFIKTGVNINV